MKFILAAVGLIGVGFLASAPSANAACGPVTITQMNWASSAVVTAVSSFLMEQGYGCTVKKVPTSTVPVLTSVAETGQPANCPTPGKTGWPKASVLTAMSKPFYDKNPELVALMSKVSFTNEIINKLLAWQEDKKATADETAVYFLTTYKDVWPNWLSEEAKTKVAAIVK